MGGNGSGPHFKHPNAAIISAIDEARWHLIEAEENERKQVERLGRAYAYAREANAKVAAAIAELTRLQHNLGDTELTDRETQRTEELTVTTPAARMVAGLTAAIAESKQVNGHLKAAVRRATA